VGGVCVHTHVWGTQTKEMVRRYKDGDVDGARRLNDEMAPAFDLLKVVTNPIAIKTAMNLLGHELGGFRLPMVEATDDEAEQVRGCLERAGVLSAASA
jgi:4-hydroxy-tetrahydrodipicolinate synthase